MNDPAGLPIRFSPASDAEAGFDALLRRLATDTGTIAAELDRCGGVLLRGYAVEGAAHFEAICRVFAPELAGYAGGDSQRSAVSGRVYTSTEYPAALEIPLHNELSYAAHWPARIFFFCEQPAEQGGETPIADSAALLAAIDPAVVERFVEKGVLYVRNLHGGWGLGRSWQQTFETEEREDVERHCRESGVDFAWDGEGLRLRERRPAVIEHPGSGERVWFNQADLWHVSRLGARRAAALRRTVEDDSDLPQHAFFGDGSPIPEADLDAVRDAQRRVEVVFPWQRGDVLLLDNVRVAHGRRSFGGPRRILTAMA